MNLSNDSHVYAQFQPGNARMHSNVAPEYRSPTPTTDNSSSVQAEEEYRVRTYVKQLLRDELFIGSFIDKKYVAEISQYRHVVEVSASETQLIDKLRCACRAIRKQYRSQWLGVTFDPVPRLWVELEREVFGRYWYKIKGVKFRGNEIVVRLQHRRSFSEEPKPMQSLDDVKSMVWSKFVELLTDFMAVLTFANIKAAVVYVSVLLGVAVAGLWHVVQFGADFSLRLMRETSYFVHSASPVLSSVVETFGKIIGGLYILIAMLWRDLVNGNSRRTESYDRMITYSQPSIRRRKSSGVVIQEIRD